MIVPAIGMPLTKWCEKTWTWPCATASTVPFGSALRRSIISPCMHWLFWWVDSSQILNVSSDVQWSPRWESSTTAWAPAYFSALLCFSTTCVYPKKWYFGNPSFIFLIVYFVVRPITPMLIPLFSLKSLAEAWFGKKSFYPFSDCRFAERKTEEGFLSYIKLNKKAGSKSNSWFPKADTSVCSVLKKSFMIRPELTAGPDSTPPSNWSPASK